MNFKKSETIKNLTRAFAAECQDGAKYQYMADEATTNQMANVATILKGLATNEMAHAKTFLDCIKKYGGSDVDLVNIEASYPMQSQPLDKMLKTVGNIEKKESEKIYPTFAETARREGYDDIAEKFAQISRVEKYHSKVFYKLEKLISDQTLYCCSNDHLWKCYNCGFEEKSKKAWQKCPLCDKNQGYIKLTLNG